MLAAWFRKLRFRLRNRGARIEFHEPVYIGPLCDLRLEPGTTLVIGPRVHMRRNCVIEINGGGRVEIGADTHFTYNTVIQCSTSIVIGERCSIGAAFLVDGNHRYRDLDKPMLHQGYEFSPLTIADDVTITSGAVIMADIGERAVIGANAVVTKQVPPFAVMGGVPARVLSTFGPEE